MKREKIGTILDSEIIQQSKIMAAKKRRHLNEIIEEALRSYILREGAPEISIKSKRIFSIDEVLSARGGQYYQFAISGKGSGDFNEGDTENLYNGPTY